MIEVVFIPCSLLLLTILAGIICIGLGFAFFMDNGFKFAVLAILGAFQLTIGFTWFVSKHVVLDKIETLYYHDQHKDGYLHSKKGLEDIRKNQKEIEQLLKQHGD